MTGHIDERLRVRFQNEIDRIQYRQKSQFQIGAFGTEGHATRPFQHHILAQASHPDAADEALLPAHP